MMKILARELTFWKGKGKEKKKKVATALTILMKECVLIESKHMFRTLGDTNFIDEKFNIC